MDLSLPYYTYCEYSLGMLQQPLNVSSALIYLALAVFLMVRSTPENAEYTNIIAVLVGLLGLSGLYWHGTQQPLGLLLDIIAGLLLTAAMATVLLNRLLRWTPLVSLICVVIMLLSCMLLMNVGFPYLTQNGSAFLPPLFLISLVALKIQSRNQRGTVYLLSGAYCLFFALILRSIDLLVCSAMPTGTHYISHFFAALSILYVMMAINTGKEIEKRRTNKKDAEEGEEEGKPVFDDPLFNTDFEKPKETEPDP